MNYFYPDDLDEFEGVRFFREYEGDVGEYEIEVLNPYEQNFTVMDDETRGFMPPPRPPSGNIPPGGNMPPGGSSSQAPKSAPPPYIPSKTQKGVKSMAPGAKAVDPGSIRPCLFRFTYIWQTNGRGYWAYLTYIGPRSLAGWRWMGWRWIYFGLDLNRVESFYCI